jgi:hypothetical protein
MFQISAILAKLEFFNSHDNLRQLAYNLADAYGNALMHDAPDADLEAKDLLLESASIRLSSRMLYEITKGSCQPNEHAIGALADRTCALDDESVGLRGLTDMLSHAAYRLENLGRSAPPADGTNGQRAVVSDRIDGTSLSNGRLTLEDLSR